MYKKINNISHVWQDYKKDKKLELKNKLVESYYPYVQHIAEKYHKKNAEVKIEELYSYGVDGLYQALDSFDPCKGIEFETFSYRRINGSIIDNIRSLGLVSRSIIQRQNKINKKREELEQKHKRNISDEEIFEQDEECRKEMLKSKGNYNLKINNGLFLKDDSNKYTDKEREYIEEEGKSYLYVKDKELDEGISTNEIFRKLSCGLEIHEKRLVYLSFYKGLSVVQIAKILNIPEQSVRNKIKSILVKMRQYAQDNKLEEVIFLTKSKHE
jgi:RNA polymerase sigma factor for flagellar operon FliA